MPLDLKKFTNKELLAEIENRMLEEKKAPSSPSTFKAEYIDWDAFEYYMENCKTKPFNNVFQEHEKEAVSDIIDAFLEEGYTDIRLLAYALATVRIECGSNMRPVREGFAATDAQARAHVKKYKRKYAEVYTFPGVPGDFCYYGRGLVQLTWYENYKKEGIQHDPDRALDPDFAARLLFKGLLDGRWNGRGKSLMYYLDKNDPVQARRTVNVLNKAELVADYYKDFLLALSKAMPLLA